MNKKQFFHSIYECARYLSLMRNDMAVTEDEERKLAIETVRSILSLKEGEVVENDNPILQAIYSAWEALCDQRGWVSVHHVMEAGVNAWEYYQGTVKPTLSSSEVDIHSGVHVEGKFGPLGNMQGSDHPFRKD